MKQIITRLALLTAVICASPAAFAYDCIVDDFCYNLDKTAQTATVTYRSNITSSNNSFYKKSIYSIPQTIKYYGVEYTVTAIGEDAFKGCTNITYMTLASTSITSIGDYAFDGCTELTSLTFPKCLTEIGKYAFNGCASLDAIYLDDTQLATIGNYAFYGCSGLLLVYLPETLTAIGNYAFQKSGITDITIPDAVTTLGNNVFKECTRLQAVTLGKAITTIGSNTFNGCTSLIEVSARGSLTSIGTYAFYGCTALTKHSSMFSKTLTTIGDYAFAGSRIGTVTIPESVTTIGEEAFAKCSNLRSINYDAVNCTTVGSDVFSECPNVERLGIGNKVTDIPSGIFSNLAISYDFVIPDNVKNIGSSAFRGCGFRSVTLPDNLTTIERFVFADCEYLNSVVIPETVTAIGNYAFYNCARLSSVVIPNAVTSVGAGVFENCTELTSATYNAENCTKFGTDTDQVFKGCDKLTTLYIGKDVKRIPEYAFYNDNNVTELYCAAPTPPTPESMSLSGVNKQKCTLYVPQGSVDLYKANYLWRDFYNITEYDGVDDITVDSDNADTLYRVYNLQGVQVADGIRQSDLADILPHGVYILVSPSSATRKVSL